MKKKTEEEKKNHIFKAASIWNENAFLDFVLVRLQVCPLIKILQSARSFDCDMKQHAVGWRRAFCQQGLRQCGLVTVVAKHQGGRPAVPQKNNKVPTTKTASISLIK